MKQKLRAAIGCMLVVLSLTPLPGMSAPVSHTAPIKWIHSQADGSFVLTLTTDSATCLGSPKQYYVVAGQNGMTAEGAKRVFAAAMLALSLNKSISVYFESATAECYVNRVLVREY
jgi:hypothetical protein